MVIIVVMMIDSDNSWIGYNERQVSLECSPVLHMMGT